MQEYSAHTTSQDQSLPPQLKEKRIISTLIEYGKTILITLFVALLLKTFVVDAYRIQSTSMANTLQIGDFLLVNKLAYGLRTPHHFPFLSHSLSSFTFSLFQNIHRGDVVVFEYPGGRDDIKTTESVNYIKRCIGLPGDTVEIQSGLAYINKNAVPIPPYGIPTDHPKRIFSEEQKEMFPQGSTYNDVNYGPLVVPKQGMMITLDPASINQWLVLIEREGHTVQIANDSIFVDGKPASTYRIQQNYYFVLGDNRDNSLDSRYWGFVGDDRLIGEALFVYWSWDTDASVSNLAEKVSTIRWKRIGMFIK